VEQTRVDTGLSNPLARPTLLAGWFLVLIGALVGGLLPHVDQWGLSIWVAVAAIAIDFAIVTVRRPGSLTRPLLATVVIVSAIAVVLLLWDHRELDVTAVYALGYLNMGVSLLIMRGHLVVGGISSAVVLGSIVWIGVLTGKGPVEQLERLAQPLVTVAAFSILYAIAYSIEGKRSRTVAQQLHTVIQADAMRTRAVGENRALSEIPALAQPILERIAAGEPLTPEFHREVVAVNEAVRNRIRRDVPHHAGFLDAIDEARGRGMTVRVIGTEDPVSPRMPDALATRLIDLLATEGAVAATVRFLPGSRGGSTTLLLEQPDDARRYEFAADGTPRGEPR